MVLVLVFLESLGLFMFLSLGVFYNFSLIGKRGGELGDKPFSLCPGKRARSLGLT